MKREGQTHRGEHRLDRCRHLPLEPDQFCRRWVEQTSGKGYRKLCINRLAAATRLSPKTVKDWGANFTQRPRYIPHLLRQIDLLNQFKQLILEQRIKLPPDFPQE